MTMSCDNATLRFYSNSILSCSNNKGKLCRLFGLIQQTSHLMISEQLLHILPTRLNRRNFSTDIAPTAYFFKFFHSLQTGHGERVRKYATRLENYMWINTRTSCFVASTVNIGTFFFFTKRNNFFKLCVNYKFDQCTFTPFFWSHKGQV